MLHQYFLCDFKAYLKLQLCTTCKHNIFEQFCPNDAATKSIKKLSVEKLLCIGAKNVGKIEVDFMFGDSTGLYSIGYTNTMRVRTFRLRPMVEPTKTLGPCGQYNPTLMAHSACHSVFRFFPFLFYYDWNYTEIIVELLKTYYVFGSKITTELIVFIIFFNTV